ncbi:MAG: hypothetical protein M0Z83_00975 [Betaproteobacteria bacterium]|nr:hypothetical protein [Betaproteobacteria bacterium]
MMLNEKLSEAVAVLAIIPPSAQAPGVVFSPWVELDEADRLLAIVQVGTFGANATVDASIAQAQDAKGANAKPIGAGKAIALAAAMGNDVQATLDVATADLDSANGFAFVQLGVSVGVAATETAAVILGGSSRYEPASSFNAASVVAAV